ncbi:MAG TPA: PD-(D/E)XK nuclease family protein [Pyrinomonadaceae bacterium]|jgi:hypothetical protein
MIITNKTNLPAPLVSVVSQERMPRPDVISVTQLIGPPQIRLLTLNHWGELEEDASDRIWSTMGRLMHQLLESHARIEGHRAEGFRETEVGGVRVTGVFDLHDDAGTLTDYKFVSVWTTADGLKPEWVAQLNVYAELLRRSGATVRRLQVAAIYRDWSKGKALGGGGYPPAQVQILPAPLWESERASAYMAERVRLHLAAQAGEAVECTPAERWARPPKFAVMKTGRQKAVRLYDVAEDARGRAAEEGKGYYVQERPGASVRCESYCSVSRFCPQYARLREEAQRDDG